VEAQQQPFVFSRVDIRMDPTRRRFVGSTVNVERLRVDATVLNGEGELTIELDGESITAYGDAVVLVRKGDEWALSESALPIVKNPTRAGPFKTVFNHHVALVPGTLGNDEENAWAAMRARYDAEQFWYQGNGDLEIVPDTMFDPRDYPDRSIVLYGNSVTNVAWDLLLKDSPVQVDGGQVRVGDRIIEGNDLGVLLIRPRADSDVASVAAVSGTGVVGMRLTSRRPYLNAGFAYPDITVFKASERDTDGRVCIGAGFFGNDWSVERGELLWK